MLSRFLMLSHRFYPVFDISHGSPWFAPVVLNILGHREGSPVYPDFSWFATVLSGLYTAALLLIDTRINGVSRYERYVTSRTSNNVSMRNSYLSIRSSYAEALGCLCVHLKICITYVAGSIQCTNVTRTEVGQKYSSLLKTP